MLEEAVPRVARWKLYLPWIVLLLGLLATIVTWRSIVAHEIEEISWGTQLAAESIRTDLREGLEWQRVGLDRLALLWEGNPPQQSLWDKNAELYIQHRPGCVGVAWIEISGDRHFVTTKTRIRPLLAFNGVPTAAMEAAKATRSTLFSMPDSVGDGSTQWAVVHPAFAGDEFRGYVVAFFDSKALDDILLDVTGLGFSFAVVFPGQLEYALPMTNRAYEQRWATMLTVPLPGVKWQLRVWPNPSTMIAIRSHMSQITLVTGTMLSLLAFLTVYFAARVSRSSARITLANEALQREMAVREGAEKELRRARDELEARVQDRTAELATANVLLQREITEHEHAESSLRQLTGQLFHLRDEEQRRLARELHDGATQTLIALSVNLALIRDAIPSGDCSTTKVIADSTRLLQQCTEELRTISYLLHPPLLNELGLAATLHDFAEGFQDRSGIRVSVNIDPGLGRFGQQLELTVFRVVQEALSNIRRHAQSKSAAISLEQQSDFLHLEISDAGLGIPPEVLASTGSNVAGMGIAGMRERVRLLGGRLEIQASTAGTKIDVVLPVAAPDSTAKKAVAGSTTGSIAAA